MHFTLEMHAHLKLLFPLFVESTGRDLLIRIKPHNQSTKYRWSISCGAPSSPTDILWHTTLQSTSGYVISPCSHTCMAWWQVSLHFAIPVVDILGTVIVSSNQDLSLLMNSDPLYIQMATQASYRMRESPAPMIVGYQATVFSSC
jgi:hypothetical protein